MKRYFYNSYLFEGDLTQAINWINREHSDWDVVQFIVHSSQMSVGVLYRVEIIWREEVSASEQRRLLTEAPAVARFAES